MSPEEKATELIHLFCNTTDGLYKSKKNIRNATKCALVCVKQIIKHRPIHPMNWDEHGEPINQVDWWKMVEQILKKKS